MAARKLKQPAAAVNQPSPLQPAAPAAPAGQPNLVAAHAAVWEAIGKLYGQEGKRDDLPDGYAGRIELSVAAKVEGVTQPFRQGFTVDLTAGHATQRASSQLPNVGKIVGHILGLLNATTREAVLRDLPAIYAANDGDLPDVPATVAEAAESLLSKLRASKQQKVRGSVSAKVQAGAMPLSLVG